LSRSDLDLIHTYRKSGEAKWLDELVERHVTRIRKLIYPMVCNHSTADDLTQETFVRALRSLHQFEGRSEFATWLGRIAINTCHDYLRRKSGESTQRETPLDHITSDYPLPLNSITSREAMTEIEEAILELPPKLRSVINLVCINKLEPAEAAKLEQCSIATIYWRIHQSRKLLKQRLAEYL
jgi:RNA polymerase sigma-70 factor (ECF subfamily)